MSSSLKTSGWQQVAMAIDKDRTHLRDMIAVGLVDSMWTRHLIPVLAARLQQLLDDPDG